MISKKDDPLVKKTVNFFSHKCPDIELFRQSKEIDAEDMQNLTDLGLYKRASVAQSASAFGC